MPTSILKKNQAALLVVDMQTRLLGSILDSDNVSQRCLELIQTANQFDIPILLTEQNPGKLGATTDFLLSSLREADITAKFTKMQFGAVTKEVNRQLMTWGVNQVIVCGIETHVCVQMTCLELTGNGYSPFLISDATASGLVGEKEAALRRMSHAGITITTTESCLFELLETADSQQFKFIQGIAKSRRV